MKKLFLIFAILTLGMTTYSQAFVKYYRTDKGELIESRSICDSILIQEEIPREKAEELLASGKDSLGLVQSSKAHYRFKGYCIKVIDSTFYQSIILYENMLVLEHHKTGKVSDLNTATYSLLYYLVVIIVLMLILFILEQQINSFNY